MQMEPVFLPNIQRKLEAMAAKGWMLFEIGTYTMTFQKVVPQNLKFNILLNPMNEGENSRRGPLGELEELCVADGWEFVLRRSVYVVFKCPQEMPIPIYSDPQQMIEKIKSRVYFYLFIGACFGMIIIFGYFPIVNKFNYSYFYEPITVSFFLFMIYILFEASAIFIPAIRWLVLTKKNTELTVVELPDFMYNSISFTRGFDPILSLSAIASLLFLRPLADVRMFALWAVLGILVLTVVLGFRKRDGRIFFMISSDVIIRASITVLIFSTIAFGGINVVAKETFSTDRALRLRDFGDTTIVESTYNNPSIGLFAILKMDYFEHGKSANVSTKIICFISKDKMNEYWEGMTKSLLKKERIIAYWGMEGYYLFDTSSALIKTKSEVIEIHTSVYLTKPSNIDIVKKRLGITEKQLTPSQYE
jgi:hypothetical protein